MQKREKKERPLTLDAAQKLAFGMLSLSARSRREIEQKLEQVGFPEEVIASVMEEIEARGWVDDEAFAEAWVGDRAARKGYGKRRLSMELQRKGIEKETISQALTQIEPEDELRHALPLAEKKWTYSTDLAQILREKRRIADYLLRRGFSHTIIQKVFEELMTNREEM